ncbi:MAG: HmuY family protein [Bacteroidota bacterium]
MFIDFSANRQTAVARTSWDLAFSSKAGEFRVLLNSANGMLVRATNKTDLGSVTTADTVGFGGQLSLGAIFGVATSVEDPADLPAWILETTTWMDDPKGDITKTAIASISATDSENKVYIVNRGTGVSNAALGWKKVRVTRDGDGYSLQYADINSSTITTVKVAKNADTDLTYASMTSNSTVGVEPAAADWDIAWTGFTNTTNFGPGTPSFPYYFQDVVIQNTSGVATAQVLTATVSYDAFAEANLTGITFVDNNQINIGSSWRSTGPPPGPVGQKTDRFYLVKDAEGNIYKLMFTALTSDGERGKPSFKFDLVKKGS